MINKINNLKNDIEILLTKYPELKNTNLIFNESDFVFAQTAGDAQPIINNKQFKAQCEIKETQPEIITGHSAKIELRKSPVNGYGVFAKETIEKGELIEESKLLKLGKRAKYLDDEVLKDYAWGDRQCKCDECIRHGYNEYIALGFGPLYNHAHNPNTNQDLNFKKETICLSANIKIEKNQEIFVCYGKDYWLTRKMRSEMKKWRAYIYKNITPNRL